MYPWVHDINTEARGGPLFFLSSDVRPPSKNERVRKRKQGGGRETTTALVGFYRVGKKPKPEPAPLAVAVGRWRSAPGTREWRVAGDMASRILANLIVAGGSALMRAASQAYRQAIVNAQRTGVAQEAANGAAAKTMWGKKVMTLEEARQVLGVDASATYSEVYARYEKLFESNEKGGSFYLQSKIYRAREALDGEYDEATVKAEREAAEARANGTQKKVDAGAGEEKEGST